MKRLILTILLVISDIGLTGCISVTRHEHEHHAVLPVYKRYVPTQPAHPFHHHADRPIAMQPHPRGR